MHSGPRGATHAELRIDRIAAGDAGIGRVDGLATFVPRTAPGDLVRVRLRNRRRYAEGTLVEVLTAGPDRVEPSCSHYVRDACGGCQMQHLAYDAQLLAKQDIVRQALSRIGHRMVEVEAVRPSPEVWRYRNKLTLTVRGRGAGRHGGLRRLGAPDEVFDLTECPISAKPVELAWGEVREAIALLPAGDDVRVVLRWEVLGVSAVVKGGGPWGDREAFLARCPSLTRVRHDPSAAASTDEDDAVASLDAFTQVNDAMAREMEDHVVAVIRETSPARVVDAYGGQGRIAGRLSSAGIDVSLIEFDPEATRIAAAECPGVDVRTARVEDTIAEVLPADLVLVNPPRTGLHARVCEVLEGARPQPGRLVYVSCDPATLARDLGRLPSWRVERVSPFDLFPQTAHVETVCVLSPEVVQ